MPAPSGDGDRCPTVRSAYGDAAVLAEREQRGPYMATAGVLYGNESAARPFA